MAFEQKNGATRPGAKLGSSADLRRILGLAAWLAAGAGALSCSRPGPAGVPGPGAPRPGETGLASLAGATLARVAFPDGRSYLAEVARTPEERARGLMFRDHLEKGAGMVFLFERPDIYPFWMKNTLIPLDIIWLDADGEVVHLERSAPPCPGDPCPSVTPLRPASWVLEVTAGEAVGLHPGDRLVVGPEPAPPPPLRKRP